MRSYKKSLFMVFLLCTVFFLDAGISSRADELTANEILSRMKDTYANAKTYQDKGLVKVVIRFPERTHIVKKPFTTAFIRPDRLRYEYKEIKPLVKTSKFVAYLNGNEVKVHWDLDESASEIKSIDDALATAAGISGGSARAVPSMLRPDQSRFRNPVLFYSPKRADDELIDGINCFRLEDPSPYRNLTMWIDKDEFLLRKMFVEKDLDDSIGETTTTYSPILNGVVEDELLMYAID